MSFSQSPSFPIIVASNQTVEEYSDSLKKFGANVKQLTKGNFQGNSVIIDLGDVLLIRRSSKAKYISSWCLSGSIAFVFSLTSPALFVNAYQYCENTQIASVNSEDVNAIFPENSDQLVVTIKVSSLASYLSGNDIERFLKILEKCEKLIIDKQYKEAATEFIYRAYRELQGFHNDGFGINVSAQYCGLIISYLYEYLFYHKDGKTRKNSSYERVFQRGLRYIEKMPEFSIDMDTLASEIYASKRSVQYAFNKVSGLSPMQFIKAAKMHEIRKELIQAKRKNSSLTDILERYQVKNIGRFSREYLEFFGERPKGTISRFL